MNRSGVAQCSGRRVRIRFRVARISDARRVGRGIRCGKSPNTEVRVARQERLASILVPRQILLLTNAFECKRQSCRRALKERLLADGSHDQDYDLDYQQRTEERRADEALSV